MKSASKQKRIKRGIRHNRVRARVFGAAKRPRLSVFRANRHIYVQLIDDSAGKTLAQASSLEMNLPAGLSADLSADLSVDLSVDKAGKAGKAGVKGKKSDSAKAVGKAIAQKALAVQITNVVFDRGGYKYHGRVKALAEGAREGGLKF